MSAGLMAGEAICRAECEECDWVLERALDENPELDAETNKEIVERVARNHAYKCRAEGEDRWGDEPAAVDVRIDAGR